MRIINNQIHEVSPDRLADPYKKEYKIVRFIPWLFYKMAV